MQSVLGPAIGADDVKLALKPVPTTVRDVRMAFDGANPGRETKPKVAVRTCQFPSPQDIRQQRRYPDNAIAGLTLRRTHNIVLVCATLDVDRSLFQIDIRPHEAAKLA